ncbi:Nucleoporin 107kD [Carabus blaptoides fortunei]
MDLNRSVRLLEDALSPHGRSLLRTGTPKKSKNLIKDRYVADNSQLDLSVTVAPDEMRYLLEGGISIVDHTLQNILQNSTFTGSALANNKPWENASDALYMEYLEVIQARTSVNEIFETVSDLARCCTDTLNVIKGLKSKVRTTIVTNEKWLENERNTWRLIYCLYQDRLNSESQENNMPYLGVSEKLCVENLYKRDSLVRESQLIIDWLECNAQDQESNEPKVQYFTDRTIGWENTLHQLQASDSIVFRSTRPIVTRMDPDAPLRQNLPLHDLDIEDEERLCRKIFRDIRCGRLEEAQALSLHCGHPWRAALLEGWRLHHDPNLNYTDNIGGENTMEMDAFDDGNLTVEKISEKFAKRTHKINTKSIEPIEGNVNRDIWKKIAWEYCHEKNINIHERATIACYCGCLQSLLPVCSSWEDQLWAYMKTLVDIRVESEIRDFVPKEYNPLPSEYWNNKMTLDEVFEKISATRDNRIRDEANSPDHLIQKYLILDQIPHLMKEMETWIMSKNINPQFLRFLAHLVLFLKQIGHSQRDDIANKVLESYVRCLMQRNEAQLVAYYTATLEQEQQIKLYASFLENITDNEERKLGLQYGEETGLNIKLITKTVVENIRNRSEDFDDYQKSGNLQTIITEKDQVKIAALDWLLFYPAQRAEAIIQCNALISYFLTLGKVDAAKSAFAKIPINAIDTLLSIPDEEIPELVQRCIREHLCYKAYLDAHESFNDWFKYFHHSRPVTPPVLAENATFTEKVAHEHRVSQHKAETERWKLTITHLAKTARTKLYNVLLFPDGGWLNGSDPSHLRHTCIPETVLLLYSVLSESGQHTDCIQLADILTSEKYQLYKVYSKTQLEDILKKFFESSIVLLDEKKDMWGNYVST